MVSSLLQIQKPRFQISSRSATQLLHAFACLILLLTIKLCYASSNSEYWCKASRVIVDQAGAHVHDRVIKNAAMNRQ